MTPEPKTAAAVMALPEVPQLDRYRVTCQCGRITEIPIRRRASARFYEPDSLLAVSDGEGRLWAPYYDIYTETWYRQGIRL